MDSFSPHYLSRIFNQTEIDIINNRITLGYILSKVTNLRVEGQLDSNGNQVDINNADIQADPFVHRGAGKFDLMLKNLLNPPPPPPLAHIEVNGWGLTVEQALCSKSILGGLKLI